ncbi:HNH endonuclease [Flexivirga lutea]
MSDSLVDVIENLGDVLDATVLRAFHDRLDEKIDTNDLLAELRACEELKNALAARQARLAVAVHEKQQARDVPRGIKAADTARKVGSDVALARRCAPQAGSRLLGLAHAVTEEMPHTRDALAAGVISEWDATALCRETACLSREDRGAVDAAIAGQLGSVSHQRLESSAREHAYRLDPEAVTARRARAESERRVTLRPAPDCMTRLTALLPVKGGVACYAALSAVANATATPEHPRGQVMADTLVERVTGRSPADGAHVEVNLVMPLDSLTGDVPAYIPDYGPIPADLAREWVIDPQQDVRVRRLFSFPGSGDLVGMERRGRTYTGLLAKFIKLRDQTCRTPFCSAPIRHIDHIKAHAEGGETSERNGEGFCERCNYVKEHPDHHVSGDATQTTVATGGLLATSHPPSPPGLPPPTRSHIERTLIDITWAHWTRAPGVGND